MREITGPQGRRRSAAVQYNAHGNLALLHDALTVGLLVRRIAPALTRDPYVIEVKIDFFHVQIADARVADRRENTAEIGIGREKSRFDERRMRNCETDAAAFVFATAGFDPNSNEFSRA